MKNTRVLFLTQAGIIGAVYAALTFLLQPISFGPFQIRISEMLTILPYFTPAAVPGLAVGCFFANLLGGALLPDIVFGSLATLIGAWVTYLLRGEKLVFATIPPIAANTAVVPFILKYAYSVNLPLYVLFLTIGAGETAACGVLGYLFGKLLLRHHHVLFPNAGGK